MILLYSSNNSDNSQVKELIEIKNELEDKIKVLYNDKSVIELEIMKIRKNLAKLNIKLKGLCECEWTREPQLYSELYCIKCGVYK